MKYKEDVIIIIPVYKEKLDIYECVALNQLHRTLGRYPMCFIAPRGLQMRYDSLGKSINTVFFDKRFFKSKKAYSSMLLSPEFYEKFSQFKFMLIYQLDAFVFSDELEKFCRMDYDYIGAPVSRNVTVWCALDKRIGNGGFSLRKVRSCYDLCKRRDEVFKKKPSAWDNNEFLLWEDLFFSFAGTKTEFHIHTPSYSVAQEFAVEHDGRHAFKKIRGGWRPFGCHGWVQNDYCFWRPLIESYGYKLPPKDIIHGVSVRKNFILDYVIKRILRSGYIKNYNLIFMRKKEVILWGMGEQGELCYRTFKLANFEVKLIFEKKYICNKISVPVLYPSDENITNSEYPVIVATIKYEGEISERLKTLGFCKGVDFFLWSEIRCNLLRQFSKKFY